jgi:hypothetical protein
MIILTCQQCEKKYKSYPCRKKHSHFCSKACFNESRRHYRICRFCRRKFRVEMTDVEQGKALFCSKKCRGLASQNGQVFTCPCGKLIYRRPSQAKKHGYCSRACFLKYATKKRWVNCEVCGKRLLRKPSLILKHIYCSQKCRGIKVPVTCPCGKVIYRKRSQVSKHNYCSSKHFGLYYRRRKK